jgi:hypothetical protein
VIGLLKKLIPARRQKDPKAAADRGILVFEHTSDVIQAENVLKSAGWTVRVMGPPQEIRSGCDLVIEFPLIEELNLLRELANAHIHPLAVVPVTAPLLAPVELFQTTDLGAWLMVRAANMKITIAREDLRIVNISGGGCPDVPYLAQQMVGKTLTEVPHPRDFGHTLCGYALELAYQELRRQC